MPFFWGPASLITPRSVPECASATGGSRPRCSCRRVISRSFPVAACGIPLLAQSAAVTNQLHQRSTVRPPSPVIVPEKTTYNSCNVEGMYIAITFDDGPNPELTPRLLDMLKERGIKATFFVVGQNAEEYPDIVRTHGARGWWNFAIIVGVIRL